MELLTFADFTKPEDIPSHPIEHAKAGIFIPHEGMKFKMVLLDMAIKCSKKAIFSNVDLASINRPASIASNSTQLEGFAKPFAVMVPYLHSMAISEDCVDRLRLLLSGVVAYMGESLLSMNERIPILPLLGETLRVI